MTSKQKWWLGFSLFLSIISAIFAVISLCNSNSRNLDVDYIGVVGCVLGASVTILVGWQIYSLIKLDDIREGYKSIQNSFLELKQNLDSNSRILNAESTMLHGSHYITWYNIGSDESALGTAYFMLTHALRNYALERKGDFVGKCLGLMRDCVCITHKNNVWDKAFSDEVDRLAEQDFKVIFKLIGYFTPEQAVLFHQIRKSRLEKCLCAELLLESQGDKTQRQSPKIEEAKTRNTNCKKKGKKK